MAGSKKDAFETSILEHIFKNMAVSGIGDSGGILPSSSPGSLYVSLFTANPSDSAQGTETSYTNYNRIAVARSAAGWLVTAGQASNAALITFAQCGTVGATLTGFGINKTNVTGADDQIYWGSLNSNLAVSTGVIPEFAIGALTVGED
jgi:hypothetical protein